jgi:hypothetical protein
MPEELVAAVALDIVEFVVMLRTFVWAYEAIPFEIKSMDIIPSPRRIPLADFLFIICLDFVK